MDKKVLIIGIGLVILAVFAVSVYAFYKNIKIEDEIIKNQAGSLHGKVLAINKNRLNLQLLDDQKNKFIILINNQTSFFDIQAVKLDSPVQDPFGKNISESKMYVENRNLNASSLRLDQLLTLKVKREDIKLLAEAIYIEEQQSQ